jgi:hypothetical protein
MDTLTAIEYDVILEGLERVAHSAPTSDERAIADLTYAKIVNLVVGR